MGALSIIWNYVIPFLVVLTPLVFVHELGHYLVARWCGVRVEVFSIGFGREIYGWTDSHGTRWKFSLIPFGGYVKMFGEIPGQAEGEEPLSEADEADSFHNKSLGQRAATVSAGPLANFLFAVVILTGMFIFVGQPFTPADVGQVLPGSAADRAGFQPGDLIKRIDGADIERFEQVVRIVQLAPRTKLAITVERDGRDVVLHAVTDITELTDRFGNTQKIGRLGVSRRGGDMTIVRHDPATAAWRAVGETIGMTGSILDALWQMIAGVRTAEDLGGPIRIAKMSGDMWKSGFIDLLMFATILSINLGLINLFPVPMLDGGHLLFYAFEAIRGKPIGERVQDYGFRIGVALVLGLMVFVTWNDLVQFKFLEMIVELVT